MVNRQSLGLGCSIALASLALHCSALLFPLILFDDFQYYVKSLTWQATKANLWVPANEHSMPLGRLTTWLVVQIAGRPTLYAQVAAFQGPIALLLALPLVYMCVKRELESEPYAWLATALFGVTSVYQQAVTWFAASFSVITLDFFLLGLLAAQKVKKAGSTLAVLECFVWVMLAPAWFASGVLAGPLCSLYLLPAWREIRDWKKWIVCLSPSLGTAVFLAVSLPLTAKYIMHLPHYQGRTAVESFHFGTGVLNTGRSIVDNLLLGVAGLSGIDSPLWLVVVVLAASGIALIWWTRGAAHPRLIVLGLALILCNYILVYSARAQWTYEGVMTRPAWSRYHLLPHLGLVLIVCGGLPVLATGPSLLPEDARRLRRLVLLLFLVSLPRSFFIIVPDVPEQRGTLRKIEQVDARCHAQGISAEQARGVLGHLPVPLCNDDDNGWDLLRGSAQPIQRSEAEVRRQLEGEHQGSAVSPIK